MESNPYAKFFRSLKDQYINDTSRIVIRSDPNHDQRTHTAPVASQVAAIWVEDGGSSQPPTHDIIVRPHSGSSQRRCSTFPINEVLVQTIDDLVEAEEQEIKRELLPHEEVQNRPDLISRVFRAKLTKLKKDIVEGKLFGNVAAFVYVVEFQKRGLPHAHFLIILDSKSKIRSPDQYDAYVCAEIPDRSLNPHIYEAVLKHMMHGPYGRDNQENVCMRDDNCKNKYPRYFAEMKPNGRNSFPIYRRRDDDRQARIRGVLLDNRWADKYLYKYIYKGHDRVLFAVTNATITNRADEISAYQSARWISPPEAAWRIFRFLLNDIYPNIVALQVHLPNMQIVTYRSEERLEDIAENNSRRRTMLTAFFERNRTDRNSRLLLYE
ncbi:uncharacterized protein LOC130589889 [Beta vulgaris subsp. vulgaris]|uniref:uncharacterized protein LOC130589889 n=1 Tax=Beta vulgaris subsp. vulgaris TaxID=3555 RepID=UPI0025471451|nr:uncharacterized protein LOC130589889 [Beta vulgaris subsp. vulgaris]